MLTTRNVPVLIDFGFGEVYDLTSPEAFHSNLKYGTPEVSSSILPGVLSRCVDRCALQYLAPERARGMPHDTRKADIWSLGVSFFEILTGRTPFEEPAVDGDDFTTDKYLQRYWYRTVSTHSFSLFTCVNTPLYVVPRQVDRRMEDVYWHGKATEAHVGTKR